MNDISYNNWNAMSDDRIAMQIGEFVKHHRMQQNNHLSPVAHVEHSHNHLMHAKYRGNGFLAQFHSESVNGRLKMHPHIAP